MPTPSTELSALRDALHAHGGLQLVMVFGSVARQTARADSDIDVAVLADAPLDAERKMRLVDTIARSTGRAVDLVDLATAGQPLAGQILQHGHRLLGTAAAQAAWATRTLLDANDFLPYVQRTLAERRLAWIG
nr:nucleotidyltransferase domain-containing protein [uncultured Albidiferax sp.]